MKRTMTTYAPQAILLLLTILLSACADELPNNGDTSLQDRIVFSVDTRVYADEATPTATRSDQSTDNQPVLMEGSDQIGSLYLHTAVINGIAGKHIEPTAATRGTIVTTSNLRSEYGSFGVLGFDDSNHSLFTESQQSSASYTYDAGPEGNIPTQHYWDTHVGWPKEKSAMRFYAYAPQSATGLEVGGTPNFSTIPTIKYIVPSNISDQKDLLFDCAGPYSGSAWQFVSLRFRHILTAIEFQTEGMGSDVAINSIKISGISKSGTYSGGFDNDGKEKFGWSDNTGTDGEYSLGKGNGLPADGFKGTVGRGILGVNTGNPLFLIPQTCTASAKITVNITTETVKSDKTKGAATYDITASLEGKTWKPGCTVIYKISPSAVNSSYALSATVNDNPHEATVPYTGGDITLTVTSTSANSKLDTDYFIQEPWTAQYSYDGGVTWTSTCDWLSGLTTDEATGGITVTASSVTSNKNTTKSSHSAILKSATELGTFDNPYDLSSNTQWTSAAVPLNTANCYVISAPGWYMFPLVYGNAIKNGQANTEAYNATAGTNVLGGFLSDKNQAITAPFIENDNAVHDDYQKRSIYSKAVLLWESSTGLIDGSEENKPRCVKSHYKSTSTEYPLEGGAHGDGFGFDAIIFHIGKENIRQGNAVIAYEDMHNRIFWSWHIWVTDQNIFNTTQIWDRWNDDYSLMPVALGQTDDDGSDEYYEARSVLMRITQTNSGKQYDVTINQNGYEDHHYSKGSFLYYQWGRKDPFVDTGSELYKLDGSTVSFTYLEDGATFNDGSIADAIKNPMTYYRSDNSGSAVQKADWKPESEFYWNLWDNSNTGTASKGGSTIKTIYDPCPVGFCVPPARAFTGFLNYTYTEESPWSGEGNVFNAIHNTGYFNSTTTMWQDNSDTWNGYMEFYCKPEKQGGTVKIRAAQLITYTGSLAGKRWGVYWTATPAGAGIKKGGNSETGDATDTAYDLEINLASSGDFIHPLQIERRFWGLPIRPVRNN